MMKALTMRIPTSDWIWHRARAIYGWPVALIHESLHIICMWVFGVGFTLDVFWKSNGSISYMVTPVRVIKKKWQLFTTAFIPFTIMPAMIAIYLIWPGMLTFTLAVYVASTSHAIPSAQDFKFYRYHNRMEELIDPDADLNPEDFEDC